MSLYQIIFSEQAAKVRDSLATDRQEMLVQALQALARSPYTEVSWPVDDHARFVALTRSMAVEYIVNDDFLLVLVRYIVDTEHTLLEEGPS